jgi:sirohydrochlorin cobaltochelatase
MELPPTVDRLGSEVGLLLVGHGTRSELGRREFLALADSIARRAAPAAVEAAFLELAEPTINAGLSRLVERGARRVIVVPLLLFAAGHAKDDIPAAVQAAAAKLGLPPGSVLQVEHLGCDERIVEQSRQRFTEALLGRQSIPAEQTCLLIVGRGSRDESATAEMHQFARLRAANAVAFLAMAQPAVSDVLPALAAQSWRRIVVQPHLLFHGELLDRLHAQVRAIARQHPEQEWIVTSYLGEGLAAGADIKLLSEAVFRRIQAAGIRVVGPGGAG